MISVKQLKAGQVVWECECGHNHRMVVKDNAVRVENRQSYLDGWEAYTECGTHLYQSDEAPCYGPRLYNNPQYVSEQELHDAVFDPSVSDLDYFLARKKHHNL